jgi:thiamine biosynthesis lipoprotein
MMGKYFLFLLLMGTGFTAAASDSLCQNELRFPSMGTIFEIQFIAKCETSNTKWQNGVQDLLKDIESEFSLYQPNSPLSRLNRDGRLDVSSELFRQVLRLSLEQESKTLGKFNITVLPVLNLIQKSFTETGHQPSLRQLTRLKPLLDPKNVLIEGTSIRFRKPGMKLSLDGIVKGYAVDKISGYLRENQVQSFLLNFSGNMKWQGLKPNRENWKIQAWNPVHHTTEQILSPLVGSIASSGPEHNSYSKNSKWHHLIDPQTIRPAVLWAQTTVIGPDATECDVLSTASFMMSQSEMKILIQDYFPTYQIYAVDQQGRFFQVAGRKAKNQHRSS